MYNSLPGFYTLLVIMAAFPVLVQRKVDISFGAKNLFTLMTSSLLLSFGASIVVYIVARWGRRSNANPK